MTWHRLRSWDCPSGNNVVADIALHGPDQGEIRMAWDSPPPLTAEDEVYYVDVIRPRLLRLVSEYMERPFQRALVLTR